MAREIINLAGVKGIRFLKITNQVKAIFSKCAAGRHQEPEYHQTHAHIISLLSGVAAGIVPPGMRAILPNSLELFKE
jgi:hypothetical protein